MLAICLLNSYKQYKVLKLGFSTVTHYHLKYYINVIKVKVQIKKSSAHLRKIILSLP